ncbi:hypothetical protein N2152v2_008776 [Parachlorella kessleri]
MASSTPRSDPVLYNSDFLRPGDRDSSLGLILLNRPLPLVTLHLWQRAAIRICADGGANRLHDELPSLIRDRPAAELRDQFLPDLIAGDLDSIRPSVMEFYQKRGVKLLDLSEDQMTTDLTKNLHCMQQLREQRQLPEPFTMVAVGGIGGRLDHVLANLNALYTHRDVRLVLCGDDNLTRLIPRGRAVIRPGRPLEGPTCGLIPLQGPAVGTSSGLRWNLESTKMQVGGLISTSNIMDADEIAVESDSDLVWTVEYDDGMFARVAE